MSLTRPTMTAMVAGLSTTGSVWRRDGARWLGKGNPWRITKADDGEAAAHDERREG